MTSKEIAQKLNELENEKTNLEKELYKTIERENSERLQIKRKAIIEAIHKLWENYWSYEDWSKIEERLNQYDTITQLNMWLENDVKDALKTTKLKDVDNIRQIVNDCNADINFEHCIKDAEIRLDFAAALRSVKCGDDLSGLLGWGFNKEDLINLMKLHKSNKFRTKIEDLLTDCNFHHECGLLCEKKYDEFEQYVTKD